MDKVTLCSGALVWAGCNRISALNEDSEEAATASQVVDERIDFCLSLHPWRFASRKLQLSRITGVVPESVFEAAYTLPPCIRVLAVRVNDLSIEFDRFEAQLYCDAQETDLVVADLLMTVDPAFWPGYFTAVVSHELAAIFAIALAEDEEKAAYHVKMAGRALTNAKTADSQGRTASRIGLGGFRNFVAGGTR